MTALVLSAGGMYGAYQAGAWKAIADVFQPDLIVGASIGAINGWAIAGGCHPDQLIERWLNLDAAAHYRWKFPRGPLQGVFDTTPLQAMIRDVYETYQPQTHFAMVVTDLMKLRPVILRGNQVSWQHLVASTAIIGLFDQVRLGGRIYSDGGLLSAVPLWAAAEMGATRALVIDVLPAPCGCSRRFARRFRPELKSSAWLRPRCSAGPSKPSTGPSRTPRRGFAPASLRPPQ
jgi:NTE family protein